MKSAQSTPRAAPGKRALRSHRALALEPLEERQMLDAAAPWWNEAEPLDVNADGFITPLDALQIINRLNAGGAGELPPLQPGAAPPPYYDTSHDNMLSPLDVLLVLNRMNADRSGPSIAAKLKNDTGPGGIPNTDGISTDPAIAGTVTDASKVLSFRARLDNTGSEVNLLPTLGAGGTFEISAAALATMRGTALADGQHVLRLQGMDQLGLTSVVDFTFTLKRSGSATPLPDLLPESDTGPSQIDNVTNDDTPTIEVAADPGSIVTLLVDGLPAGQQTAQPTALFTLSTLSPGQHLIRASSIDGAGNVGALSSTLTITILAAPGVKLSIPTFIDDVTPQVTVEATNGLSVPVGGLAVVDVDLNNDGAFTGNERGYASATMFGGAATFQITPQLPVTGPAAGPYQIKVRARVTDTGGKEVASPTQTVTVDTLVSQALKNYVTTDDGKFAFTLNKTIPGVGYTAYVLDMTSQQWRTALEVNKPIWKHWVTIVVPDGALSRSALLFVTGGSNTSSAPSAPDPLMVTAALATKSVAVLLPMVPSEPLIFADETFGRSEDEIIAYSYDKFLLNPADQTWPVLLAMVKSAVKAMDAVQAFVPTVRPTERIDDFVISGASKRGWTTWLTAAVDDRVRGIVPMVFDALNLDEQMVHHYGTLGFFSPAIKDYQDKHIFDRILTPEGQKLGQIVDPYRYKYNGRFNIPKLSLNSAGDEFFVSDSSQFYIHDLPGPTYLRYLPNTGHSLDESAGQSLVTFYSAILSGFPLPDYSWSIQPDGAIRVQTVDTPTQVTLWQATNPVARDFRHGYNPTIVWTSSPLADQGGGVYQANVATPATGATAFFIELTFPSGVPGVPFKFTTDVHVATNRPLFAWPFPAPAASSSVVAPRGAQDAGEEAARDTAFRLLTTGDNTPATASGPADAAWLTAAVALGPSLRSDAAGAVPAARVATAQDNNSAHDGTNALSGEIADALFADTGMLGEIIPSPCDRVLESLAVRP